MMTASGRSALTFRAATSASCASVTIWSAFPFSLNLTVNCIYDPPILAPLQRRRWREKDDPEEMRVVGFEHHDCHEYQHQHRRQQDGVGQGQPLPGHVHEDSDDQASLQHHEQQDQRPSEIAMEAKVVDEIGAGAENEQPSPDHEIELDRVLLALCLRGSRCECVMHMTVQRMLLSFHMYRCVCHAPTSPKVKKSKDEHPHKIDEVPVQAGDFDDLVMPLPAREKAVPFDIEVSPPNLSRDGDQENHADRHVGAVEACDHEKA